ncbi:MAG: zinc finger domain-containing protein [Candidatus Woesearchaeota archaeon]|nr:zinc finger domain-containing protein [Candidatus Woesearchaeota archaeon]
MTGLVSNESRVCNSCKRNIANVQGSVIFACPSCTAYEIVRCSKCRVIAAKYKCPGCGFEGPH